MTVKPVNQIELDSNIIKTNDINSIINIKITDVNNNPVNLENEIDYFYLIRNKKYYPVTHISFNNEVLSFKLPNLYKGLYKIEIKDKKGSIYPAHDDVSILLNESFEGGKASEFFNIRESILKDFNDIVNENSENFKGDKGDQGIQGIQGVKGDKGNKGDKGDQGIQGVKGDKGNKGDKGDQGIQGIQGIQGVKGEKGEIGDSSPSPLKLFSRDEYNQIYDKDDNALYFIKGV